SLAAAHLLQGTAVHAVGDVGAVGDRVGRIRSGHAGQTGLVGASQLHGHRLLLPLIGRRSVGVGGRGRRLVDIELSSAQVAVRRTNAGAGDGAGGQQV